MAGRAFDGLILDFAGVLTTNMVEVISEFERREGLPAGTFLRMWADPRGQELYRRLEVGEIDQRDWNEGFGSRLKVNSTNLMGRVLYTLDPAYEVLEVARDARRAGVRTAVLSNSLGNDPHDPYLPYRLHDVFDVVVMSTDLGIRKPDPAIFRYTLDELGVAARSCVCLPTTLKRMWQRPVSWGSSPSTHWTKMRAHVSCANCYRFRPVDHFMTRIRSQTEGSCMSPRSAGPVVVVTLGGTIAMSTTAAGGVAPALTADDILGAVPGLAQTGTEVRAVDFRRLPGASLSFSDLDALHQHIHQVLDGGAAGVVVVQGTDTIEESAYHLELKHTRPQPIVVTGAMRNPTLPGADGPANLLAAILTVAAPASHGRGVLVVLNDEIHTAAQVRKTHTTSTATFQSPDSGPAGHLVEHTVRYLTPPPPRLTVPPARAGSSPRVGLYTATLGDDGSLLNAIVDSPDALDGLVVAGMGVGHVPQPLVEPLARAATCMPVLLASRTGSGSALTGTYGFPGSERDLIARGLTSTGYLHPLKARILLRAALASGATGEQIRQAITAAGTADPSGWPWPATDTPVGVPS